MTGQSLRERFLDGMSRAACTVNVVTTDGPAGRRGVTVSAMTSVSVDSPNPTLLVCLHHLAPATSAILQNGVFCVNVLRADQAFISDSFAGRIPQFRENKFACATWKTQLTGAPRLADPLVAFDCALLTSERVGTHYVIIGEVQDVYLAGGGSALVYTNRAYATARPLAAPTPRVHGHCP